MEITGSAKSTKSTCSSTDYDSTLTITNKKSTPATLSFDYAIEQNSGTIQVDGTKVTVGGPFKKELAAQGSIKIYIKSGSTSAATKITLTNVKLVADIVAETTFELSENGSYTVDGALITETVKKSKNPKDGYAVEAMPNEGYKFLGWYYNNGSEKKYISTAAKTTLNIDEACTITAKFAAEETAVFETGGQPFTDLNEAVIYLQKNQTDKITLISSGSLEAGKTYTIPSGVNLLIPYSASDGGTFSSTASIPSGNQSPLASHKAYVTLTVPNGAASM